MPAFRMEKINTEIRHILSKLILEESEDPRLHNTIVSITKVDTAKDLQQAKVYFSVLDEGQKHDVKRALESGKAFFHARINKMIRLRRIPSLIFYYDESIARMDKILDTMKKTEIKSPKESSSEEGENDE